MHGADSKGAGRRGLIALTTAAASLLALAVMAGVSWSATGSSSASQYQYGTKTTICHHTHSKKHPYVTITVGQAAVKAHLRHGDTLGACTPPTTTTSTTTTTTTSKDDDSSSNDGGHGQDHGKSGSHGHAHGH